MNYCLITFRSVTPAQRGESALRRAGISAVIQRTPKWMEEQGCGYSLRLRQADVLESVSHLRNQNVVFRKVYLRRENGTTEEISV